MIHPVSLFHCALPVHMAYHGRDKTETVSRQSGFVLRLQGVAFNSKDYRKSGYPYKWSHSITLSASIIEKKEAKLIISKYQPEEIGPEDRTTGQADSVYKQL